jgi:hypothetical protein
MKLSLTLRWLAHKGPESPAGALSLDQAMNPAKKHLGGPIAAQLGAQRTADDYIVARKAADACWNVTLAPFAADHPDGWKRSPELAVMHPHAARVYRWLQATVSSPCCGSPACHYRLWNLEVSHG